MTATLTSLILIEILLNVYSKVEVALMPAAILLGVFMLAKTILKLNEKIDETVFNLMGLVLTLLIGFSLGFGFYRPAIFATLLALIFITLLPTLEKFIKKIWPFNKG